MLRVLDIIGKIIQIVTQKNTNTKNGFGVNSLTLKEHKELSFREHLRRADRSGETLMKYEGQAPDQMRLRVASDMPC